MIQEDTVKLLRECNAGIKMGVSSLDEVLPKVQSASLRSSLEKCRQAHGKLGDETHALLARYRGRRQRAQPRGQGHVLDEHKRQAGPGGERRNRGPT